MTERFLVDTNILVYAYDRSEPEKQSKSLDILDWLATRNKGALSTQILSEFFWAVTRKIAVPISIDDASTQIELYIRSWETLNITPFVVIEAVRGVKEHHLSIWDAQIWAVARMNQIPVVLSEDFPANSVIEGIRFMNPLAAGFDIAKL